MNVIETHALSKRYGAKLAVDHFDMHVPSGEIYGFVGRNGAGKSTVLKMLSGLARPTEGDAQVLGKTVGSEQPREHIGVLIESAGIYPNKSAYANMMAKALCMGVLEPKEECLKLLAYVGLADAAKIKTKKYSMGMKQRLGLALALLGNPAVLLLDEPLNGLDPEGVRDIRQLIIKLNQEQGVTVVISSHVLEQLEKMATRYGVIREGKMVREFTAKAMEEECRDYIRIRTSNPALSVALINEHLAQAQPRVLADGAIEVRDEQDTARIAALFQGTEIMVQELYVCSRDTEDYFVELMGDERHV